MEILDPKVVNSCDVCDVCEDDICSANPLTLKTGFMQEDREKDINNTTGCHTKTKGGQSDYFKAASHTSHHIDPTLERATVTSSRSNCLKINWMNIELQRISTFQDMALES
jgi:hypothetical protein